ncbi:hypothetical protein ACEWY4_002128 [Coilia grayii]|uniref:Peptidase S72 domain-containing protein n=1 Tax=Coilia grayii TaxID=363190 RepID=A0ABD1KUY1_9TELE
MPSHWLVVIVLFIVTIMCLLFLGYEFQVQVRPHTCPPPQQQHGDTELSIFAGVAFSISLPTYSNEAQGTRLCQEEDVIWADLLLQTKTQSLNAESRVQLVHILSEYLHLTPASVKLLAYRNAPTLLRENIKVIAQGGGEHGTQGHKGSSSELLWPVGCGGSGQLSDLARVLEHSMTTGHLATLLGTSVLGWRVLGNRYPPPSRARRGLINSPPRVMESLPVLKGVVGFPFHYTIPSGTFQDPEDGETGSLSLHLLFVDGPPPPEQSWLALTGLQLHGIPLEVDRKFSPQHLVLVATDRHGLSTQLAVTLELSRSPVEPCCSLSLVTKRSLYSLLAQRSRVELLLKKLSNFYGDRHGNNIAILSLEPGSTVVSWYNFTLCDEDYESDGLCPDTQIQSMWAAMSTADGRVNPAFNTAMLPEFPIHKIGQVIYGGKCLNVTPDTFTETPQTQGNSTTIQPDTYYWVASVLTALLVVFCLLLLIILVWAMVRCCKNCFRTQRTTLWHTGCHSVVRYLSDRKALEPRRPPLFTPEISPPPPKLWISLTPDQEIPQNSSNSQC